MTSSARSRRRLELAASGLDVEWLARAGLVLAVVASGLLLYHLTRGSSFSTDDWIWIDTRRGNSLHTFLAPYNGHLSLVPVAIYRLMFALFGIGDFVPYRILLLVVASAAGVVIFEYARHRVGELCALLAATLLLFLGPGWNDIMQPFQVAWLIAVASGILALSLLDRRRTTTDVAGCLLILISIATTSVGVAFAVAIAVDLAVARRRWRDAWIVGLPLVLYVAWAIHYHPAQIQLSLISSWPANLAQTTRTALAGVVGLSRVTPSDLTGLSVAIGTPLLVLAAMGVIVRAAAGGWNWARFLSLTAALATFTLMTTLVRSFQSPFESRYTYVVCVLVTLMVVELAGGLVVPLRAQLALAVLTLIAVVSNVGVLQSGGNYLRQLGAMADATLGAVELDRGSVASDTPVRLYPLGALPAGRYLKAAHALGTPAYTVVELEHANPAAQGAADAQSVADGDVKLGGVTDPSPSRRGACKQFLPQAVVAPGQGSTFALELGSGRVSLGAGAAPVTVSVRRFAPAFTALATVQAHGSAIVSLYRDRAPQPWHLQLQSLAPVRVCTLSGAR
jgi:hypothetical protein